MLNFQGIKCKSKDFYEGFKKKIFIGPAETILFERPFLFLINSQRIGNEKANQLCIIN